ncbi:MAG: AAA family ATPase [Clostridia bacterium]|nr:AAA family ATPase [Clostridia bacterium]
MNIKEATKHIKHTIEAYLEKDENGGFVIPVNKQRPVFLYGPPGIGKTAVMEKIAKDMNIGIVSYSMTHHTRQSALGLPFIKTQVYDGIEYSVSEFTMSEILADVYGYIERTGHKQGILFLDEINCVSETLAPSMLRFLQYKTFGSHPVPDGWVIVAAGNPPEYNKSVKEYDIATLDRIQKLEIQADYDVWREYAVNEGVHPSIITYLDAKPTDFYIIENTPDGKQFITARGWEDLSRLMFSFEKKHIEIDFEFIFQYVQVPAVAADFASFYKTFKEMREMCAPKDILDGIVDNDFKEKLKNAGIEEKLGFINLLSNSINEELEKCVVENYDIKETIKLIKDKIISLETPVNKDELAVISENINASAGVKNKLSIIIGGIAESGSPGKELVEGELKKYISDLKNMVLTSQKRLGNGSRFISDVFGDSPELKIFVSNITRNTSSAQFLIGFGCEEFSEISKTKKSDEALLNELDNLL